MSKWGRIGCVLAISLLVALGAWNAALAADPDDEDITVVAYQGAPGCEVPEGEFWISNASSEYYYRVVINATMENDSNGPARCDNDPPTCCGCKCECDLSGTFDIPSLANESSYGGCSYPSCPESYCDPMCDNASTQCPPNSIDHCNCIVGSYQVTHYSDDEGVNWDVMPPAYPTVITEKELNPRVARIRPDAVTNSRRDGEGIASWCESHR